MPLLNGKVKPALQERERNCCRMCKCVRLCVCVPARPACSSESQHVPLVGSNEHNSIKPPLICLRRVKPGPPLLIHGVDSRRWRAHADHLCSVSSLGPIESMRWCGGKLLMRSAERDQQLLKSSHSLPSRTSPTCLSGSNQIENSTVFA